MKKIVVYGHPLIGKGTAVISFGEQKSARLGRYQPDFTDPVFGKVTHSGPYAVFIDGGVEFGIFTLSGGVLDIAAWNPMLEGADALMLVMDSREKTTAQGHSQRHIEYLKSFVIGSTRPGCVIYSKVDLDERAIHPAPAVHPTWLGWPAFDTRVDRPETFAAPFEYLVDACKRIEV